MIKLLRLIESRFDINRVEIEVDVMDSVPITNAGVSEKELPNMNNWPLCTRRGEPKVIIATATVNGKLIGKAMFGYWGSYPGVNADSVYVIPYYRKQGVANKMYDAVEKYIGGKIMPSSYKTKAGEGLWKKRMAAQVTEADSPTDNSGWKNISIDDVTDMLSKTRRFYDDYHSTLSIMEEWFYAGEDKQVQIVRYLSLINSVAREVIQLTSQFPHVDHGAIKDYLLRQSEFKSESAEFFPFPVYVSASPDDEMTIGIMIDQSGKVIEIHEGNDESTPETIMMVNKAVNPTGKSVRVYGAHNTTLVQDIDISGYLPPHLFVSPYKAHAEGYMDLKGERSMFTGFINVNDVNQNSELDWETMGKTKIDKFRWL